VARFRFECVDARGEPYAVTPTLAFTIRIAEPTGAGVHAIALRCQIRIEPGRRRYIDAEVDRLVDLFGEPPRWTETLKPMQLATVSVMVPGFTGETDTVVPVPCSYDLEIASTRYFRSLDDGTVGLLLLFSGTAFLENGIGYTVEQLPWTAESRYRLPVAVWRDMVERDFPNSAWLRCSRETLDALGRYRSRHALPSWEHTLEALLEQSADRPR
jgi:Family of unknown function (DUF6084)